MNVRFGLLDGAGSLLAGSESGMGAIAVKLVVESHTAAAGALVHSHSTTIDSDLETAPDPEQSCWHRRQH